MKFLKDRILPLCMIALLGGLLPACVNDEEDTTAISDDGSLFISIAISTGDIPTARVEEDELGTIAENFIDKDDLKIYAFSVPANEMDMDDLSQSNLLKEIYPGTKADNKSVLTSVGGKYYLRIELDSDIFSEHKKFRLVAVANLETFNSTLTNVKTLDDLQQHAFTISTPNNISWIPASKEKQGIPMFGLKEVDLSDYDKKVYNEANPYGLGTMNMLRTLAKIEIVNGAELNINGVTIGPYKIKGYLTPGLSGTQLENTENVTSARIPDDGNESEPLKLCQVGNAFVAYLPEYAFASGATRELITVNIEDATGNPSSYKLSLSPYDENGPVTDENKLAASPWNAILRNHIYRYTITKIAEPAVEVTYKIEYTVCPMDKAVSADIEFN